MSGFDNLNDALVLNEGTEGKWLNGTVVANLDPLNLDRIQASIPGLFDPSQGDLPWLMPFKISPFGCGASWGWYGSPAIGSDVLVQLQKGKAEFGQYLSVQIKGNADFPSGTDTWGFQDPSGNVLRVNGSQIVLSTTDGFVLSIVGGAVTMSAPGGTRFESNVRVDGNLQVNGTATISTGANGVFSAGGQVVTVENGIVTNIY